MDLTWLIWFLVVVVVASIAFLIIRSLIMPMVPEGARPAVWAIIGIVLLIGLLVFVSGGSWHHGFLR